MNTSVKTMVEVGKLGWLKPGEMKLVLVQGHELLLARVADKYYAADNRCPHMGGNLSRGTLEGTIVTCPRHGSQFDLTDGHLIRWTVWPAALVALDQLRSRKRPLPVYQTAIDSDRIMVKL